MQKAAGFMKIWSILEQKLLYCHSLGKSIPVVRLYYHGK